ncbi:unnamed protein product [Owenia fusiformis]|uniref:Uncharacterized protein n=1 Tax=Owenia fusiformis TaxID=6347 RepID=A0A8J1UGR0_OWEFU|nr:unnamed protein product [Owenia fusiformis]
MSSSDSDNHDSDNGSDRDSVSHYSSIRSSPSSNHSRGSSPPLSPRYSDYSDTEEHNGPSNEIHDPAFNESKSRLNISEMQKNGRYCDITILVGGKSFPCHKVILASWSTYFDSMFSSGMTESNSKEITLKDISVEAFQAIVDYMYRGVIKLDSVEIALNALKTVDMLQFDKEFHKRLVVYLCSECHPANCLTMLGLADLIGEEQLKRHAKSWVLSDFKYIIQTESFLQMDAKLLIECISDVNLVAKEEEEVFFAVVKWLDVNYSTRKQFAAELLSNIQFCFMESHVLFDSLEKNELLKDLPEFQRYLNEAKRHQVIPCYRHDDHGRRCRARTCNTKVLLMFPEDEGGPIENPFHVPKSHEETYEPIPLPHKIGDAVEGNGIGAVKVCLVGHTIFACVSESMWKCQYKHNPRYSKDPEQPYWWGSWQPCSPKSDFRHFFSLTLAGSYIYAVGGKDINGRGSRLIERYDWEEDQWRNPKDGLITGVFGHAAVVVKNKLYILGGITNLDRATDAVQVIHLDQKKMKIVSGPKMLEPQEGHSAVEFNGRIYSAGKQFLMFDPETAVWTRLSWPSGRIAHTLQGMTVYGSSIMMFGGALENLSDIDSYDGHSSMDLLRKIVSYNVEEDSFDHGDLPNPMAFGGALCVVNNKPLKWL